MSVEAAIRVLVQEYIEQETLDEDTVREIVQQYAPVNRDEVWSVVSSFVRQDFPDERVQRCQDGMAVTRVIDQVLRDEENVQFLVEAVERRLMEKRVVIQTQPEVSENGHWPFEHPAYDNPNVEKWALLVDGQYGVWITQAYDRKSDAEDRAIMLGRSAHPSTHYYVLPVSY